MATTSPDNIRTPDAGDSYALVQDLGILADTTQNALIKRANAYVGTVAQRNANTDLPVGTIWSDTDGERLVWKMGGSGWEPISDLISESEMTVSASYGTGDIVCAAWGKVIQISWSISGSFNSSSHQQFGTVPANFRPHPEDRITSAVWLGGSSYGNVSLLSSGAMYYVNNTGISRTTLTGSLTFIKR